MSGECNVCGQTGCLEFNHCAFKEDFDELRAENKRLKVLLNKILSEAFRETDALTWASELVREIEQALKE